MIIVRVIRHYNYDNSPDRGVVISLDREVTFSHGAPRGSRKLTSPVQIDLVWSRDKNRPAFYLYIFVSTSVLLRSYIS